MVKLNEIISGGYCIGCGVCTAACDGLVSNILNMSGQFQAFVNSPSLTESIESLALNVCPFSDRGKNEDQIGQSIFGETCKQDKNIGYYGALGIGHVLESNFRSIGSSGGIITWILCELLRMKKIDGVIHVKRLKNPSDGVLFRYGVSKTVMEVKEGAKSRYYPVELSKVLQSIKNKKGRYALVGLPCFIKAVRRFMECDPVIKDHILFCVGLVCGHLKSKAFADSFGWQVGCPPGQLEDIDFRVKLPNHAASDYGVFVRGAGKAVVRPTSDFLVSNWGLNFFRYSACDCCDDVFAETADITVGDAWLPEYVNDSKGNSIIIVRHPELSEIIELARVQKRINYKLASIEQIVDSQAGGLRDRREGLSYRLYLKHRKGYWVPSKRVSPGMEGLSRKRAEIYDLRAELGRLSHLFWLDALGKGSFKVFEESARPFIKKYKNLYCPLLKQIFAHIKQYILKKI